MSTIIFARNILQREGVKIVNAWKNVKVDFRVNGKHDHYIQKKMGKPINKRPTKSRRKK